MAFRGGGSFNAPQDGGRGESRSVAGVSTTLHCSADATLMIDTKARDKSLSVVHKHSRAHTPRRAGAGEMKKKKKSCTLHLLYTEKKKCSRTQEGVSFGLLCLITIVSMLAQKINK